MKVVAMRCFVLFCLLALPVTAEPWILLTTSGGIMGRSETLTVSSEGAVEYQASRQETQTMNLSSSELDDLRALVPAVFPAPEPSGPRVPDGVNSTLQVDDQQATWGTPSPVPDALLPLVQELGDIQERLLSSP